MMDFFDVGTTIKNGRYLIQAKIAQGGMGALYLGWDNESKQKVAVKVQYVNENDINNYMSTKFEAKNLVQLNHCDKIAKLIDFFEEDNTPVIVLEFIEGQSLDKVIKQNFLTPTQKIDLLIQIAEGMLVAHNAKIIHRDIKPSNIIMLQKDGQYKIKIIDFGIAKSPINPDLTLKDTVKGTPNYISPEQAKGFEATVLSDIYSFGVMAFELTQGVLPFTGTKDEVLKKHIHNNVPLLNNVITFEFRDMINQILDKKPENRPQNFASVLETLQLIKDKLNQNSQSQKPKIETLPAEKPREKFSGKYSGLSSEKVETRIETPKPEISVKIEENDEPIRRSFNSHSSQSASFRTNSSESNSRKIYSSKNKLPQPSVPGNNRSSEKHTLISSENSEANSFETRSLSSNLNPPVQSQENQLPSEPRIFSTHQKNSNIQNSNLQNVSGQNNQDRDLTHRRRASSSKKGKNISGYKDIPFYVLLSLGLISVLILLIVFINFIVELF